MKLVTKLLLSLLFVAAQPVVLMAEEPDDACAQQQQKDKDKSKDKRKFDADKFKRDLSMHIVREASLTPAEADKFFPVFFEQKEKLRGIERQKNNTLKKGSQKNMSERDCQRILDEIAELDKKSARVEKQYVDRMRKIVGARKVVKVYLAEKSFGRKMFHQMTK